MGWEERSNVLFGCHNVTLLSASATQSDMLHRFI